MSDSARPTLPAPPSPQGHYQAAVVHGDCAFSAGMTPRVDGRLVVLGRVGQDVALDAAQYAAAVAASNALSAIAEAAGGLDRLAGCLTMTVYVAAAEGFEQHSLVADGASDALAAVLPGGVGVRTTVGVASLPSSAPVEVALTVALRPATSRPEPSV